MKGKLALKGGTALNLFVFDVPRLSVDIDLNYVGNERREAMLEERPRLEEAIQAVFSREDFSIRRIPQEHAGGKWSLRYAAASGQSGRIDVDINYMYRVPLWPVTMMDSRPLGSWRVSDIPVVDIHELAAGKLTALLARRDWRTVSIEDAAFDPTELASQLVPSLRLDGIRGLEATSYGKELVEECQSGLSKLLPFNRSELAFLDLLLEEGKIDATLLTSDSALQERIQDQPLHRSGHTNLL